MAQVMNSDVSQLRQPFKPRLFREAQLFLVGVEAVLDPEAVGDDEGARFSRAAKAPTRRVRSSVPAWP